MRRYGLPPPVNVVPGTARRQDVQLAAAEAATVEPLAAESTSKWTLRWAGADDGTISEDGLTAYGLVDGWSLPLGPYGWMAVIKGDLGDCTPEITVTWDGGVYEPLWIEGPQSVAVVGRLVDSDYAADYLSIGTLTVTAVCGENVQSIMLVIAEGGGGYY